LSSCCSSSIPFLREETCPYLSADCPAAVRGHRIALFDKGIVVPAGILRVGTPLATFCIKDRTQLARRYT
jgi:hypothetical protein